MDTTVSILQIAFMTLYVVVFAVAIYKFPLYKDTALKLILVILFFTILTEFWGGYIRDKYKEIISNVGLFNFYYLIYFSFFFYIFMKVIKEQKFKKYIKVGLVIFWLFYLRDLVFVGLMDNSFILSYLSGSVILIYCIILYYISILESSLILVIKNDLLFWISVGLFLFYIGYIPIKIIKTWFYEPGIFFDLLIIIQFSLIIVMYSFFLIGFLWMKKR